MLLTAVGTRRPSDYSRKIADWLCTDLARCNVILCSGCAVGLDAAVHWAAIRQDTPTIGVMGCGVDYDYPHENREMKERIVRNGLLLSEYFPGTQPAGLHFPVRNRILAGISEATLVLEADVKSGSLITANLACEQGKSVLCVPPADLLDTRYSGVANLMRDGAYPVFNYLDVLYVYYLKYPHKLSLYDDADTSRTVDSLLFAEEEQPQKRPRRVRAAAEADPQKPPEDYVVPEEATEDQRRILEYLKDGEQSVNTICMKLNMSFDLVSLLIVEMELEGWVVNTVRDLYKLP
jgi:DNA processing protein